VSHDRKFVNNLADHIFVFDGEGGISDWSGSYSELRDFMKSKEQDAQTKKSKSENAHEVGEMNKQSEEDAETAKEEEKRVRELLREAHNAPGIIAKIEKALAVLDQEIEGFDAQLFDAGADVSKAVEIQAQKDAKVAKQELYYAEWERLEDILAQAEQYSGAEA